MKTWDIKSALKQDFNALYVKEFTEDWKEQRLLREIEIDLMELPGLEFVINRLVEEAKKEAII